MHLFCPRQAHEGYAFVMRQVADLDKQIAGLLAVLETSPAQTQSDPATPSEASAKAKPRASASHRYQPAYDVRGELLRHLGVDRTSIPGINVTTTQTLWAELGGDLGAFKSGKRFVSWLSLCPDNRVSGGKLLSAHTKPSANRAARALRLAARRRWWPTAHKLARIVYAVLTTKQAYRPQLHAQAEQRRLARSLELLRSKAENLGF